MSSKREFVNFIIKHVILKGLNLTFRSKFKGIKLSSLISHGVKEIVFLEASVSVCVTVSCHFVLWFRC